MNRRASRTRERGEKLRYEFGVEIPHLVFGRKRHVEIEVRSAAEIQRAQHERLVHGKNAAAVAAYAALVAERLGKRLAQTYPYILRGMMEVHLHVAAAAERKIERAVL